MLYYDFKNYEGFKERFGIQEHGNGAKSRKNKILLAFIKQKRLLHAAVRGDEDILDAINIKDMATLKTYCKTKLWFDGIGNAFNFNLANWTLGSSQYAIDDYVGLCEDGDFRCVRYVKSDCGRVYKMKAGKFLKNVMEETEWGRNLPEPVKLWLCEEFTQDWETHSRSSLPQYTLKVDDNFSDIYDSDCLRGDFGSCMVDQGTWTMYRDSVSAKAAYLLDKEEDKIIARCIIFTKVYDLSDGDKILRLAERQYSSEGDEVLKKCLVDALIKAGEIDGYKKVGAGCHDNNAFVLNDGTSIASHHLKIDCDLDGGDDLSYMDSFVYYDIDERVAYNTNRYHFTHELDTTDGQLAANYDSWHECYTANDVVDVYYHGREYTCDEDDLWDFRYIEYGYHRYEYHHDDDCVWCSDLEDYVVDEDATYSEILDEYFYDEYEMSTKEEEYKAENWYWSEYDEEYFEDEDEVTEYTNEYGNVITISTSSLENLVNCGDVVENDEGEFIAANLVKAEA